MEQNPRQFFGKTFNDYYNLHKHNYIKPVKNVNGDIKNFPFFPSELMRLSQLQSEQQQQKQEVTFSIVPFNSLKVPMFNGTKKQSVLENPNIFDPIKFIMELAGIKEKTNEQEITKKKSFLVDINKEYKCLDTKISSLKDLITLGKNYKEGHEYPFDLQRLCNLVNTLEKLDKMIGMKNVKQNIVDQIVYFLSGIEENDNMLHTVITGSPGVGKTVLGKIIAEIYFHMGIIQGSPKKNTSNEKFVFKIARRSDLIGEYLGHTAVKTQKVIDECQGGVLFIDEAYSLGSSNNDKKDSYAKECIDTLNQNLSENKNNFICIIAGYPDALDKCFFSQNEGLKRRFPFRYDIDKYDAKELTQIFLTMVDELKWSIDKNMDITEIENFMKQHYDSFPFYGGDIETLLFHIKIAHAYRALAIHPKYRKQLNIEDIEKGFDSYVKFKGKNEDNTFPSHIYI